jgi:hypothetical protein
MASGNKKGWSNAENWTSLSGLAISAMQRT